MSRDFISQLMMKRTIHGYGTGRQSSLGMPRQVRKAHCGLGSICLTRWIVFAKSSMDCKTSLSNMTFVLINFLSFNIFFTLQNIKLCGSGTQPVFDNQPPDEDLKIFDAQPILFQSFHEQIRSGLNIEA